MEELRRLNDVECAYRRDLLHKTAINKACYAPERVKPILKEFAKKRREIKDKLDLIGTICVQYELLETSVQISKLIRSFT
jgi:hypothetical protein